ncbi:MAG TPA: DUF1992 domain-containing protein [Bacteriovoracaceae bacterium]|nr:DUF1992 domain-containing protein [Bacteriovoracaceae bacterium]
MLTWLAEQRIQDAIERGEFENYPGKGEPFPDDFFTDNPYYHSEGKLASLDMKGYLPHEIFLKQEIAILIIRIKRKYLTPEERTKLMNEMSLKQIEYEARMDFLRN